MMWWDNEKAVVERIPYRNGWLIFKEPLVFTPITENPGVISDPEEGELLISFWPEMETLMATPKKFGMDYHAAEIMREVMLYSHPRDTNVIFVGRDAIGIDSNDPTGVTFHD